MTALIRSGTYVAEAHANWGRWVASCGLCPSAEQLRPHTPYFECRECGAVTEIIWPPEAMVAGVERLLMMRPDPSTRNWIPGEALHDLMRENAEHGILPQPEAKPGELLMVVDDQGIRIDHLPILKHRVRKAIS